MHGTQKKYLSMFRRVRELLSAETENALIAAPLKELDGIITRMSDHGITQDTLHRRTRAFTVTIGDAARSLRRDLLRPARLASRTVFPTVDNGATALRSVMRMPSRSGDNEALAVAAHAFANSVEEHAAAFAVAGLPKDFSARIRKAADEFVALIDTRSKEDQRRMASTQGLAVESQRGVAIVRLLDALVEPVLRSDAARLAEWRKATRIRSVVSGGVAVPTLEEPVVTPTSIAGDTSTKVAA